MQFELIPILDKMAALYQMPRTSARFDAYLLMLQGATKGDMILPIAGYNPMAKEEVLQQVQYLRKLQAEQIIERELTRINPALKEYKDITFQVILNLADDVGGAWSNFYATNYTSKFDMHSLVKRNFCTPYLWTSEKHTEALIAQRTRESVYRTLYCNINKRPKTLKDFVEQETFVQTHAYVSAQDISQEYFVNIEKFYLKNIDSEEYSLIFNFFYGDEASKSLEYPIYGRSKYEGFAFAKYLASKHT